MVIIRNSRTFNVGIDQNNIKRLEIWKIRVSFFLSYVYKTIIDHTPVKNDRNSQRGCPIKRVILKILQSSQENISGRRLLQREMVKSKHVLEWTNQNENFNSPLLDAYLFIKT